MINTTLSCTPPIVQLAGTAALKRDRKERDDAMLKFREKVVLLTEGLNRISGFRALDPTATFYVFPNVARVCNDLGITSHGLALYMLQGADDRFGIACLGGECFGQAGGGFLRFSCAERTIGSKRRSNSFRPPSRGAIASSLGSPRIRTIGSRVRIRSIDRSRRRATRRELEPHCGFELAAARSRARPARNAFGNARLPSWQAYSNI
jgi:hypothetical protein